jgi:erythromycin esterase-like protein
MTLLSHRRPGRAIAGAVALTGEAGDYDELIERVGDRRLVLLGEGSHGTHEFYRERARITRRLIEEKGFTAVAVEADWPDAYRVNRYVTGSSADTDAIASLGDFQRFPAWMWRNLDVVDFVTWLREHNDTTADHSRKVRFYGLDLYSLRASMEAVVDYLESVDVEAAADARRRYSCFDHVRAEGTEYGRAVTLDPMSSCADEVIAELMDMRHREGAILARDGWIAGDEYFYAEQNARLVYEAERYYRAMYLGRVSSWNLRDRHMARTLDALLQHLDRQVGRSKIVVWEHNSHVGDARATEMGQFGELNVGQLVRSAYADDCLLVGFTTSRGWVTAASEWGGETERKLVVPASAGSYEEYFSGSGCTEFTLQLGSHSPDPLHGPMLERAIGVIYRPETERISHYFQARIASQFDAVIHLDLTNAVEPLERGSSWAGDEPPETYPSGL